MDKKEFVKDLAGRLNTTQKDAATIYNAVMEKIIDVIASGDKLQVKSFGTFYSEVRGAREARNPSTGEKIQVPEKRVPKFRFSTTFKKNVFEGLE